MLVRKCVLLFLFVFAGCLATSTKEIAPPTDAKLKQWYREYNGLYFEHRLPDALVLFGNPGDGRMAVTRKSDTGLFFVILDFKYNQASRVAQFTVLHEECHLDTWDAELEDHGPKWQGCMQRLAATGAFATLW